MKNILREVSVLLGRIRVKPLAPATAILLIAFLLIQANGTNKTKDDVTLAPGTQIEQLLDNSIESVREQDGAFGDISEEDVTAMKIAVHKEVADMAERDEEITSQRLTEDQLATSGIAKKGFNELLPVGLSSNEHGVGVG